MGDREMLDGVQNEHSAEDQEQTPGQIESFLIDHFGDKVNLWIEDSDSQSNKKWFSLWG